MKLFYKKYAAICVLDLFLCVRVCVCLCVFCVLLFVLVLHCPLPELWVALPGSPYMGKAQPLQEQGCPFLWVCAVYSFVQTVVWLCSMMHATAHGGRMDTVTESLVKADSGRKIPCCTGDLNMRQYCTWLFSQALYQLSYPHPS